MMTWYKQELPWCSVVHKLAIMIHPCLGMEYIMASCSNTTSGESKFVKKITEW